VAVEATVAAAAATVAVEATVAAAAAATATPMGTGGAERWGPRGQVILSLLLLPELSCAMIYLCLVSFVFVVAHLCF